MKCVARPGETLDRGVSEPWGDPGEKGQGPRESPLLSGLEEGCIRGEDEEVGDCLLQAKFQSKKRFGSWE